MKIGPFEILETLGGGGSGIVYRARHETLGRVVAVKQLNRHVQEGDRTFERFRREAQIMAAIRSDHVVTLYSYQVVDGRPLLEMECLERGSLERVMNQGPIDLDSGLRIIEEILFGLKALHSAGIVHRDVKPANVLQDESGRYKLTDFGLSVLESDVKPTLEAATIRYVAPECISENPSCDFRSDLYSVGMVAYEALLGGPGFFAAFPHLSPAAAFGAKWLSWLKDKDTEATPLHVLRPDIPVPLSQLVARLMAKDPERRYGLAEAALEALSALGSLSVPRVDRGAGAHASGAATRPQVATTSSRKKLPHIVAMSVGGIVLAIAAVVFGARMRAPKPVAKPPIATPDAPVTATGRLVARVTDERGQVLSGVSMRLLPGGRVAKPSEDGSYIVDDLAPGDYEMTATLEGYRLEPKHVAIAASADSKETVILKAESLKADASSPPPPVEPPRKVIETPGKVIDVSQEQLRPNPTPPPGGLQKQTPANHTTIPSPPGQKTENVQPPSPPRPQAPPSPAGSIPPVTPPGSQAQKSELSNALLARLTAMVRERNMSVGLPKAVSLEMTTRPSPFLGRGLTADYVATLQTPSDYRTFSGQHLGFAELTLRAEVVNKAAEEILAYLTSRKP